MRWFYPSWNGDLRIERVGDKETTFTMIDPTPSELVLLGKLAGIFVERKWWGSKGDLLWDPTKHSGTLTVSLAASIADVAPLLVKTIKPGRQTLNVLRLKDGVVEACESEPVALGELAKKADEQGVAAASVKRPTPCCPQCAEGAIEPATEVLLSFLTPEQHADWARDRTLVVEGGYTNHRYQLAHRKSATAKQFGKICYDLDDGAVLHFHDVSVPPEEEVLAAMLILQYREDWLRHEATCLDLTRFTDVFNNPFGGAGDGVEDSLFTQQIGQNLMGAAVAMREHLDGR